MLIRPCRSLPVRNSWSTIRWPAVLLLIQAMLNRDDVMTMAVSKFSAFGCFAAMTMVVASSLVGCGGTPGPALGQVSGTVTLDGSPLDQALVEFVPEDGRPSFGTTGANGKYVLQYTDDKSGAVIGKHHVKITKNQVSGEVAAPTKPAPKGDPVPAKYNTESTLEVEVKSGSNVHDFKLES